MMRYSASFAALAAALVSSAAIAAAPDLIVDGFNPVTGQLRIKNQGDAPAGESVASIKCFKRGHRGGGGGCPDPGAAAAGYALPGYPDRMAVKVPQLPAGKTFVHVISFVPGLVFPPGTYDFTIVADDGNRVRETPAGEANNVRTVSRTVP